MTFWEFYGQHPVAGTFALIVFAAVAVAAMFVAESVMLARVAASARRKEEK